MTAQTKVLHKVGNMRDMREGRITRVRIGGRTILLIRKGDDIYAIDSSCGKGCMSLSHGILEGFFIRCPWYHEYYDIRTGKPVGSACCGSGIKVYETRISETTGDIFLYLDSSC